MEIEPTRNKKVTKILGRCFFFRTFAFVNRRLYILFLFILMIAMQSLVGMVCAKPSWNINKGMLKEKVTGIVQDERGFLWLSTWGGLFRYDGKEYRSFKTHPGDGTQMPYDRLDAVKRDKKGNVWCRSFYHPYCFDVRTSTFIDVTEKLEKRTGRTYNIHQIYPMVSGYVWLLTKEGDAVIRVSVNNPRESACIYSYSNGKLKKGRILSINEDSRGMAWILSEGGITVPELRVTFPKKRFDHWRETSHGCIYLATNDGELWWLNTRTWSLRRVRLPIRARKILRISGNKSGELVISTDEALITWYKGRWQVNRYEERITSVKRLFCDKKGRYWLITDQDGAMLLPSIQSTLLTLRIDSDGNYKNKHDSWFFALQPTHTLLMARNGGLCYYYEGDILHHVKQDDDTWYQPQIGRTFVDRENNVWIYNSEGGLDKISQRMSPFRQYGKHHSVCALFTDSRQRLWVGDTNGKLTISGKEYNLGIVYAIEEMADGTMWVGTKDNGLYRLLPNGENDYTVVQFLYNPRDKYSISANDVYCMTKDHHGNLWVGTYSGGVNKVRLLSRPRNLGEDVRFINKNNELTWMPTDERSLNIRSLLCTKEGIMCIGTSHGIYAFKDPQQVFHNERKADDMHSLSSNEIMTMYQDRSGDVYCLTPSAGICRTKAEALMTDNAMFTVYDQQNLAPSDAPMSITADANDNLWIVYASSVAMFNKDRTIFYNWQSPSMSSAEIVKDSQGNFIAATINDIISWNPTAMNPNDDAPRIAITALTVAGQRQNYDADLMDTIRFESNERDISLQLSALTMKQGEKIKYAYRTDTDSTWIMQGDNDRLSFLNMRAGYHTIQVRSTNASGVWCNNSRTITLYVKPTFWETTWALILYITIGIIVIGGIAVVWAYIYRLNLKMRTQEEMIKQRMDFIHNVAPLIREDNDDLLERVRQFIDSNISNEELTIPLIASEMGMSRSSFSCRFKELAGISPHDYLTHYRIAYAKQLLTIGGLTISDVAYKSGFADPKYFSRVFKKIEGVSPSSVSPSSDNSV